MGYYSGSGITKGGGETTRNLKSFYEWGSWAVRQKCVTSTNTKPGVSQATAQATHGVDNLSAVSGGSGDLAWIIFDAEGTRTTVAYSQIGDSNLYELNVTTETYNAYMASSGTRYIT